MGIRVTITEAEGKGWISSDQAKKQREIEKSKRSPTGLRNTSRQKKDAKQKKPKKARLVCSVEGDLPQERLWRGCVQRWPGLKLSGSLTWERLKAIPGRKFSIDIAFDDVKLAVEVDGYQNHGFHLDDFKRDRIKDRLLTLNGWCVVRYFTGEIFDSLETVLDEIERIRALLASQKG